MDINKSNTLIRKGVMLVAMSILFAIFFNVMACSKKIDITNPNNFSQIEGVFVHKVKKFIMVESSNNQKYWFKFGVKTTFIPKEWPPIGNRIKVRYLNEPMVDNKIGRYFIAYEVRDLHT